MWWTSSRALSRWGRPSPRTRCRCPRPNGAPECTHDDNGVPRRRCSPPQRPRTNGHGVLHQSVTRTGSRLSTSCAGSSAGSTWICGPGPLSPPTRPKCALLGAKMHSPTIIARRIGARLNRANHRRIFGQGVRLRGGEGLQQRLVVRFEHPQSAAASGRNVNVYAVWTGRNISGAAASCWFWQTLVRYCPPYLQTRSTAAALLVSCKITPNVHTAERLHHHDRYAVVERPVVAIGLKTHTRARDVPSTRPIQIIKIAMIG